MIDPVVAREHSSVQFHGVDDQSIVISPCAPDTSAIVVSSFDLSAGRLIVVTNSGRFGWLRDGRPMPASGCTPGQHLL